MFPADQHLDTHDLLRDQVDARLIMQHELLPIDRAPQIALDLLALDQMQGHLPFKESEGIGVAVLGLVHREVRVLHQCIGIMSVIGIRR